MSSSPRSVVVLVAMLTVASCTMTAPSERERPDRSPPIVVGDHIVPADLGDRIGEHFASSYTAAFRNVRAVLVTVDGQAVAERYDRSLATTPRNSGSVTLSVLSCLVGIAVDERSLPLDLDETLAELLPARSATMSPSASEITLRQLLTMTSGLAPDPRRPGYLLQATDDDATLATGPLGAAGRFALSNAGAHLIATVLAEHTGTPVAEYARQTLFGPMGIAPASGPDPVAVPPGARALDGTRVVLSPRDMAALGRLWLDGGRWGDRQLVPREWIQQATRSQTPTREVIPGYGYLWWVTRAAGHPAFAALGYGGQMIEVVPALDTVVVVSSDVPDTRNASVEELVGMVDLVIAPAIGSM